MPSLAGLARALQMSPFLYKSSHIRALCDNIQPLIVDKTLDMIKNAIDGCLQECDATDFSRQVLANYWEDGMPLSSNRIIHDLLIILRNAGARVIAAAKPSESNKPIKMSETSLDKLHLTNNIENAWSDLMNKTAHNVQSLSQGLGEQDVKLTKMLRSIYVMSLGYFEDIKKYAERRENEGKRWSLDSYMNEIMGTSLVGIHVFFFVYSYLL